MHWRTDTIYGANMLAMKFVSAILTDTTEYYAKAEVDKPRVWSLQCIRVFSGVRIE